MVVTDPTRGVFHEIGPTGAIFLLNAVLLHRHSPDTLIRRDWTKEAGEVEDEEV